MGIRFSKRIRILPGVSLNISKNGVSVSLGTRGARVTVNKTGVRKTLGLPGTGLSWSNYSGFSKEKRVSSGKPECFGEESLVTHSRNTNLYIIDVVRLINSFKGWNVIAKLFCIAFIWIVILNAYLQGLAFIGVFALLFFFISVGVFAVGLFDPGLVRQSSRFAVIEASIIYFLLGVGGTIVYHSIS